MSESLPDLRARLELLKEHGVAQHDPSTGAVSFFPPYRAPVPLTQEALAEIEAKRADLLEVAEQRRQFGAAGGFQPGRVSMDEIQERHEHERKERARYERQAAKVREARAALDAKEPQQ
jgi:hypothetical protein